MTNVKVCAEWMRRQGHPVIETGSSYWASSGMGTYQAIPYHALITPNENELQNLLGENKAIAVRYSTPIDTPQGSLSYHVVYEHSEYSQKDLPKKARHDIKKGLSIASVETIPLAQLATVGWAVRQDTLLRQGRAGAETISWWKKLCLSAEGLDGFEAWGATADGKLVAALLGFQCDDYYYILYQQSLTEYLRFGVNNALTYVVVSEVLLRPGIRNIFYGLHSLDAPASVDEYKFRMGFQAKPVRQRVVFSQYFRPFANGFTHKLLKFTCQMLPRNHILSKAEGMFRFYLNGKLPLKNQPVPNALAAAREPSPE